MENRLLEAEQQLKLLETAVAQAKEAVLITAASLTRRGRKSFLSIPPSPR